MKAIMKKPGEGFDLVEIPNTLKALQSAVDGYIEVITLADDLAVVCNEEGRLRGLPHNLTINEISLCGTILIVGVDGEDFTDVPVPEGFLS